MKVCKREYAAVDMYSLDLQPSDCLFRCFGSFSFSVAHSASL